MSLIGRTIGPYQILAKLGEGGMGEVYRARDTKLNREVAIKVLPEAFAEDADRLARFTREAQTLASLNHPNIAAIYGIEGSALVMELVEGDDLAMLISRGPMPLADVLPIARQIADALEAAHDHRIIHRDLKPANIKVRADGTVKVLDFGLAKALGPDATSASADPANSPTLTGHATQLGMILGTAAYMAPEQARGKAVDRRADIWAFGVVVYEMLSGRRMFAGGEVTDVLAAVLRQDIDWTALPPDTPPRLRLLLERCLDRDVKQRLRDIGEARVEIAKIESGAPDSVSGVIPAAAMHEASWRRALPWAVAAVAILVAVLASLSSLKQDPDTDTVIRFTVAPPFGVIRQGQSGFAISPDGRAMAFSASAVDGRSRIFVKRVDQPEAQPIAGTENGALPFWSPDSQSLAFTREGVLYRTDLAGAAPRRLCNIPGTVESTLFQVSAGTWGSRGVIVFASREGRLFQVPDGGGTPEPVTSLDTTQNEAGHRSPSFLPDGRHVLFLALGAGATRGVIWAVALDNPTRTRVTESSGGAAYVAGHLLTTTEAPRRLIAQSFDPERLTLSGAPRQVQDQLGIANTNGQPGFSASLNSLVVEPATTPVHQLVWTDRIGRVLKTVGPAARIIDFALAPDERRVVANIRDVSSRKYDLWLFDDPGVEGTRLTFQPDTRRPLWARDGTQLYFTTMPGFQNWSLRLSAAAQAEPFETGKYDHFEDMTGTSRYIVFKTREPGSIWMQRIGDPSERRVLVQSAEQPSGPRVSPDGRWLAYALDLPSGPEVFVQPFDRPGERQQVSITGGIGPVWRADGRELYFEARGRLMAVTTADAGNKLEIGTPQKLFDIHTQWHAPNQPHNVEVAANGQKFLVNTIVGNSDNAPLEVTVNWMKVIRQQSPR
jgi:serine/threonine protein kinase/Tol biopolymer transport system component